MRPGPNGRKVRSARYGKGKRWQARWIEAGREKSKMFATRDAAEGHLALVEVHGPFRPKPRVTFGEYATTWRLSQMHHRPSTAKSAEIIFRKMLAPMLGRLPLVEVTRQDVQNAVIEWQTKYSPGRVHIAYGYVATVYKSAILDQLLTITPCRKISLPEHVQKRVVPLTLDQVTAIRAAMPEHWRTAVTVCASSGLRIGELGGLTYDRVQDHALVVDRQLTNMTAAGPVFGPPKSSAGSRTVPIGDVGWKALQQQLEAQPDNPHGFVWVGRQGGPLTRKRASEAWRTATEDLAGLRDRSGWHDLRHFNASLLIAEGLSPRAVADRLGHADVAETLGTYSHLWPSDQQRANDAIDNVLRGL